MITTSTPWRVRRFRDADASMLAEIYRAAVKQRGQRDYARDQISAWLTLAPTAVRIREQYGDGRVALVATDARDQPVGFSDLQVDGHIQYLYVDPRHAGHGIAGMLLAQLEDEARRLGLPRIHAEASETAVSVFERAGFERLERRELTIDTVAIHNYTVRKTLQAR